MSVSRTNSHHHHERDGGGPMKKCKHSHKAVPLTASRMLVNAKEALPSFLTTFATRVGSFYGVRYLLRKLVFVPSVMARMPEAVHTKAFQHDITQRACRAMFAFYFVAKGSKLLYDDYRLHKEQRENGTSPPHDDESVWSSQSVVSHTAIASFVGFMAGDMVDLVQMHFRYHTFQPDLWAHHVVGIATMMTCLLRKRAQWAAVSLMVTEMLVPCGVLLWWLKITKQSSIALRLVRLLGLGVILGIRIPIFLSIAKSFIFRGTWHKPAVAIDLNDGGGDVVVDGAAAGGGADNASTHSLSCELSDCDSDDECVSADVLKTLPGAHEDDDGDDDEANPDAGSGERRQQTVAKAASVPWWGVSLPIGVRDCAWSRESLAYLGTVLFVLNLDRGWAMLYAKGLFSRR
eukprot:TRINITY_DN2539_c0_g1_i1.p1 TRINITY_DN2539_c0_g1~~TRINITY_DN2539_c0_g1_i1.p1  ORF type:complete len:431 (+),score=98.17 TRINITY_DN2539_c0_g1_i1:86-1294(+)